MYVVLRLMELKNDMFGDTGLAVEFLRLGYWLAVGSGGKIIFTFRTEASVRQCKL